MDINEKKKNNPWAICGANIKDQDSAKYERCVKKVKKSTGYHEEKSPIDQIAEMITDDPDVVVDASEEPIHEDVTTKFVISEDMSAVGMMAPVQEKSLEQIEADMDAILASLGPEAPVKPEVEPEVEPGVVPDAPEPTEPDPFNPTQPAIDPNPKACEY